MSSSKNKKDGKKTMKNVPVISRCVAIVFTPVDKTGDRERTGGDIPLYPIGPETETRTDGQTDGDITSGHTFKPKEVLEDFKMRNKTCYWNPALSESVSSLEYVGYIEPHTVLVQGSDVHLENVRTAWGRRVLKDPLHFTIKRIGDVNGIQMEVIPQTQFIPLPEALCLIMMDLNNNQLLATLDTICERLRHCYQGLQLPSNQLIYETLGTLIRERKVFHTGCGYFVVTPDTFRLHGDDTAHSSMALAWTHLHPMYIPASFSQPQKAPMRSISCQADVTKEENLIGQKESRDKAEMEIQKEDSKEVGGPGPRVKRSMSVSVRRSHDSGSRGDGSRGDGPRDTLKRSSSVKGRNEEQAKSGDAKKESKQERNKAERVSLFTKLFGRSKKEKPAQPPAPPPARRDVEYATFSAQFPPPEWMWYQQQLDKHVRTETWVHQQVGKSNTWHNLHMPTVGVTARLDNTPTQKCSTLPDTFTTQSAGVLRRSKQSKSHKHKVKDQPAMVIANHQQDVIHAEYQKDRTVKEYQRDSIQIDHQRDVAHKEHRKHSSQREHQKDSIYKDYQRDSVHSRHNQKDVVHLDYSEEIKLKRHSLPTNSCGQMRLKLSSLPTRLPTCGDVLQPNYIHPKYSSTPRVNPIPEINESVDCTADQVLSKNSEMRRSRRSHSHRSHKSKRKSHHDRHSGVTPQSQDISFEYQGRLPSKTSAIGMSHSSGVNCVGLDGAAGQVELKPTPAIRVCELPSTDMRPEYYTNSHNQFQDMRHFRPIQGEESHIYANVKVDTPTELVPEIPDRKHRKRQDYTSLPPPHYELLDNEQCVYQLQNSNTSLKQRLEVADTDRRSDHTSEPGTAGSQSSQERWLDSAVDGSTSHGTCSSEQSLGTVISKPPLKHRQMENLIADSQDLTLGDSGFSSPRNSENSAESKKKETCKTKDVNTGSYLCNNIKTGKQLNNSVGKLDVMYSSDDSYGRITADALYENARINKTEVLNNMKYLHKQITVSSQNLTSPELEPDHYAVPENTDTKPAVSKKFKLNGDFHVVGVV